MPEPLPSVFPPLEEADENGLLAMGFELNTPLLLSAYHNGIFPWYNEDDPVLWWSPPVRAVLFPERFRPGRSLKQSARHFGYSQSINSRFEEVIRGCAETPRSDTHQTWISAEMMDAYTELHRRGVAISFETMHNRQLVGGLYGIRIGKGFIGESMFSRSRDASKFALWKLCEYCLETDIRFIDGQVPSPHLSRMGFEDMNRDEYLLLLHEAIREEGDW
jgi:leucyl/phenylalanyl-tRNA---protein transferase